MSTSNLKELVDNFKEEYQDNTEYLRSTKNSNKLLADLKLLNKLKEENIELRKKSPFAFFEIAQAKAFFLYTNYPHIFNKFVKDEIDMDIMTEFIKVLKQIENGEIDQNEGSVKIGNLLKTIYIDSAIKLGEKLDSVNESPKEEQYSGRHIDWKSWKSNGYIEKRNEILKTVNNNR
jgi:hypothetical protein